MNAVAAEVLPPTTTAIAEFSQTASALAQLREQLANATIDCTTTAGDKEARASRLALVRLRNTLDEKRLELKRPLLDKGRLIDEEAKRITGEILKLEAPIDSAIRAEEKRREEAKAERDRIERERIAAIGKELDAIRHLPLELVSAPSSVIEDAIATLKGRTLDADTFAEFLESAELVRMEAVERLGEVLAAAKNNERLAAELRAQREEQERTRQAEEARLAEERAQLERERAAAAEAQRKADEEAAAARAEADREAKEKRDAEAAAARAEQERIAAEQSAERQRLAEEAARIEAEKAAAREREEAEALAREQQAWRDARTVDLVFDRVEQDGHPPHMVFVEAETLQGNGVSIGEWSKRDDGLHRLRVVLAEPVA